MDDETFLLSLSFRLLLKSSFAYKCTSVLVLVDTKLGQLTEYLYEEAKSGVKS